MPTITLPYQASRSWMERQILAGEPLHDREQRISIELEELDKPTRSRVVAIADALALDRLPRQIVVLDSGVDPACSFGPLFGVPMNQPIEDVIGARPEVDEPTDDVAKLVKAWEDWLERYHAQALELLSGWSEDPPENLDGPQFAKDGSWKTVDLPLGRGISSRVPVTAGEEVVRDVLAAGLRQRYIERIFDTESVRAAQEATSPSRAELLEEKRNSEPADIAARQVGRVRQQYQVARAHHLAGRERVPDFNSEMQNWAAEYGSRRLQIGLEDGYRMTSRYLAERIAREAPGFYALASRSTPARWTTQATSPSEEGLVLRRKVAAAIKRYAPATRAGVAEVKIVRVLRPPHQMYVSDDNGYPAAGWTWYGNEDFSEWADPQPFEAVVVFNWLDRYHLIGAVRDGSGLPPAGTWAAPSVTAFSDEGFVTAADPDEPLASQARRKPPTNPGDDDIPF